MLLSNEIRLNGLPLFIYSLIILLASFLMSVGNFGVVAITILYETIVPMIIAIYCSYLVFRSGDLELLLTGHKSIASIIFTKYFLYIGMVVLLGVLQLGLSAVFQPKYMLAVFGALIPVAFVMSAISLFVTVVTKSTGTGTVVIAVLIGVMGMIEDSLKKHVLPTWVHYISFYETPYFYDTVYWLPNRIILLGAAVLLSTASYFLLRSRKLELVL